MRKYLDFALSANGIDPAKVFVTTRADGTVERVVCDPAINQRVAECLYIAFEAERRAGPSGYVMNIAELRRFSTACSVAGVDPASVRIVSLVHDEIIVECAAADVEAVSRSLRLALFHATPEPYVVKVRGR